MSFTEEVLERTRHIEKLLAQRGAEGRGLHEKVTSIEDRLDERIQRQLRFVASVRNKLVHEHNFSFDGDPQRFLATCDAVIASLSSGIRAAPAPLKQPKRHRRTKSGASLKVTQGCLPALTCAIVSLLVLPFSCSRRVTENWAFIGSLENIPPWAEVFALTTTLSICTYFISRRFLSR